MENIVKIQFLSIAAVLCISITHADSENRLRGSIITQDNQVVAKSEVENKCRYQFGKSLSPVLGYVNSLEDGRKGLEQYANKDLSMGYDVHLNINLKLQQKVESILDEAEIKFDADEVIAAVMESKTGKVLTIATSNRYNPAYITENDIPALNPKFAEYPYEPGAVMMPITLAIALEQNIVTPDTVFNTFDGKMEVGEGRYIIDDEEYDSLNVTDIIIHSSNVGISQISWLLTGEEFNDGLERFGFAQPSGIDLFRDHPGMLRAPEKFEDKMYRANSSYGYGMMATFTQLLKAYNVFNNDSIAVEPRIINNYMDRGEKIYLHEAMVNDEQVISKTTSDQIHNILVEVMDKDVAQYRGLELGGKTGTAYIAKNGRYVREYHSSFYGFANDKEGHKYTIGVLVIRPKAKDAYLAENSALPIFLESVEFLRQEKYLDYAF